jgi:short-subunit dehydrogenase
MRQESLPYKKIKDQVIVITGASSGIGLATALMAAKRGAKVVLASRNIDDLNHVVADIQRDGGQAIAVATDVSKFEEMYNLRDRALSEFGRIDTWVNNAAASTWGLVFETPLDQLRQQFETNFWGVHYGCMVAIEAMRDKGGLIINLGSEVSERAAILQTMYSSTKHAIKGYTEGLRTELEKEGLPIRVSLIRPAAIDTPFAQHAGNFLKEGAPSLPAPVYHPDVAAEAILGAAETGKRDVYAGGAAKMVSVLNHIAPRLVDYVMESFGYASSTEGQTEPHDVVNEALLNAPEREGEIRGGHKGHVARTSLWTTASLHPVASTAIVGAIGLAAAGLLHAARRDKSLNSVSKGLKNRARDFKETRTARRAPLNAGPLPSTDPTVH